MKVITLQDPWASLVRLNEKHIETRSWSTRYRGPLLIHASKKSDAKNLKLAWNEPFYSAFLNAGNHRGITLYPGCIIAKCNLVDCQQITWSNGIDLALCIKAQKEKVIKDKEFIFGDYTAGRFAWMLEDIEPLEKPIPAKGRLGLWEFDFEGVLNHG